MEWNQGMKCATRFLAIAAIALLTVSVAAAEDARKGVYEYAIESSEISFDEACALLARAIRSSGFQLIAILDAGMPDDCSYDSRVFVVYDPAFARELIEINAFTGPFAVTDRINVFEDERGTHVSYVNPSSIVRTVLLDHKHALEMARSHRSSLRALIHRAVESPVSEAVYGQKRKRGQIGRTMGVMAGGPYNGKIKNLARAGYMPFDEAVAKLEESLKASAGEWNLTHAYTIVLPDREIAILGSTSPRMESKSFSIVQAGADKRRKEFECPGIAHAGAYPVEMVLAPDENGALNVYMPHMMYRMKMYFEDAGKWALMKHMGMPGSVEGELRKQARAAFPKEGS